MGIHLVTGAAGGIGASTVSELQRRDHEVIRCVRDAPKKSPGDASVTISADLSLLREVDRLADDIASRHDSLDGLLLNAGIATAGREMTPEGFETTFAVNHLGAFLLAHRLLPLLSKAPQGRIVLTGSSDHMSVTGTSVATLAAGESHSYTGTYARSKAVAMAAMIEMAHRLQPEPVEDDEESPPFVLVNVADPGWTRTGITRHAPTPIQVLVRLGWPFQNRRKRSAKVLADLATKTEETGRYVGIKGPLTTSVLLRDEGFRRTVYDDTVSLLVEHGFGSASDFLPTR